MPRHTDAPGQGFLFPDQPERQVPVELPASPRWDQDAQLGPHPRAPRTDIPPTIPDLVAACGLPLLRSDRFLYFPGQVECIFDICSTDRNFAVKGALASGKTNVALAVAAQSLSRGGSVLYLTPFDNLVQQTTESAVEFLSLPDERLHSIRDDSTPKKRAALYRELFATSGGHLIITTPGKILNDITEGRFDRGSLARIALVIFDECHLAFGKLPYVELMQRFSANGTRLVGFTGTMGKDREQRAIILENLGVPDIYTIASKPLKRTVLPPRLVELEPTMTVAAEQLSSVAKYLLTNLTDRLTTLAVDCGHTDTTAVALAIRERHLEGPRFSMPVKKGILALQDDVRRLLSRHAGTHGGYFQTSSLVHAVDQVQQLHDRLTRFGRYAFLRLATEKMLALQIPDLRDEKKRDHGGSQHGQRRVPRYVEIVYRDKDILEAFRTVAAGTPFAIVPNLHSVPAALRAVPGSPARLGLEGAELRRLLLDGLRDQLALHDYSDHPKEAAVFSILARDAGDPERKPTIIFVELVEAARFLVDRIHTTKDLDTTAVLCVGSGHDVGVDRAAAIAAFDRGAAHVIVATSALEVGQDTQTAKRVINFIQTPEAIRLAQRMGRAGRSGAGAEIIDLVTKHYEPQYYAGRANLKKMNDS